MEGSLGASTHVPAVSLSQACCLPQLVAREDNGQCKGNILEATMFMYYYLLGITQQLCVYHGCLAPSLASVVPHCATVCSLGREPLI